MSFENITTKQLVSIAKAGLGFTLDPNKRSESEFQELIEAAFEVGAHIYLVSAFAGEVQSVSIE